MSSMKATSSGSQVPILQDTVDEIAKQLESKYRLSTIHQGEAVYLAQRENGDGLRIDFSNETSINLDEDAFSQDLTVQINRLFEGTSEPRGLKIREKCSTPSQSPNTSPTETTQEFVSSNEFRDFAKKIEEYVRMLLKEVKDVGDVVKQSIESSNSKIVNSLETNIREVMHQLSRVQSNSPNFQSTRQFANSQIAQQSENQAMPRLPTTKGFGSKDKSTCKSALLADNILRESIAEQRKEWERRQADSDDWDSPGRDNERSFPPHSEDFEDRQQDNHQRILPLQKGFRQPSDSQSDATNQRPAVDSMNPLTVRDRCAKCGIIGHWSNDCMNQDKAHCYKPFYHLAFNRDNSEATRRDWAKRLVEDDANPASKRFRTNEAMSKRIDSRDYGSRLPNAPRGADNYRSAGYTCEEPEVTRYRDTEEFSDRYNPDQYADFQQRFNNQPGWYGQNYSDGWNR